jgi:hypothetical protein
MELGHSREAVGRSTSQEFPNVLLEPEGLLLCLQEPDTGPYPEPDESSPYHPIPFI